MAEFEFTHVLYICTHKHSPQSRRASLTVDCPDIVETKSVPSGNCPTPQVLLSASTIGRRRESTPTSLLSMGFLFHIECMFEFMFEFEFEFEYMFGFGLLIEWECPFIEVITPGITFLRCSLA